MEIFPDLQDRLSKDAGMLSGGEKLELALARTLMLELKVLLLNKPSLGLSTKNVLSAFALVEEINRKEGITIPQVLTLLQCY
jgi:branched-chain amino acid transport system ATP-binding protein